MTEKDYFNLVDKVIVTLHTITERKLITAKTLDVKWAIITNALKKQRNQLCKP